MQVTISFLCQTLSGSRYFRYNEAGVVSSEKPFSVTYGLLPIIHEADHALDGSTLWVRSGQENIPALLEKALERHVRLIVCEQAVYDELDKLPAQGRAHLDVLVVENSDEALVTTARAWRALSTLPVIAITGSVGKTTTKHMLASIFDRENVPVYTAHGNNCTLEGIALDLLHITSEHALAFFELGSKSFGNIEQLALLVQPTMGLITNASHANLGNFKSIHSISQEMRSLFKHFKPSQIGIICGDDDLLTPYAFINPTVRFGTRIRNHIRANRIKTIMQDDDTIATQCVLTVYDQQQKIILQGNHISTVYAALGAAAICHFLNAPFQVIVDGLESFRALPGRFQPLSLGVAPGVLINDAHTTNPESMKAAISAIHGMSQFENKIAILGDMTGLGEKEGFWHRQIGRDLGKTRSINELVLVGERAKRIGETAPVYMGVHYAKDWHEAQEAAQSLTQPDDNLVLVKGHNAQLGNLVKALAAH